MRNKILEQMGPGCNEIQYFIIGSQALKTTLICQMVDHYVHMCIYASIHKGFAIMLPDNF